MLSFIQKARKLINNKIIIIGEENRRRRVQK